ncbi:unnamed protein product, partial [marine sediment metagenome]
GLFITFINNSNISNINIVEKVSCLFHSPVTLLLFRNMAALLRNGLNYKG